MRPDSKSDFSVQMSQGIKTVSYRRGKESLDCASLPCPGGEERGREVDDRAANIKHVGYFDICRGPYCCLKMQ